MSPRRYYGERRGHEIRWIAGWGLALLSGAVLGALLSACLLGTISAAIWGPGEGSGFVGTIIGLCVGPGIGAACAAVLMLRRSQRDRSWRRKDLGRRTADRGAKSARRVE